VTCLLMAAACISSSLVEFSWEGERNELVLRMGGVIALVGYERVNSGDCGVRLLEPGFYSGRIRSDRHWVHWPHWEPRTGRGWGIGGHLFVCPLWLPSLLILIPTAFLWYRDRRHPPGHCQKCGYDLTGNKSGVCPECGTELPMERQKGLEV
jgi:hypothetical protein